MIQTFRISLVVVSFLCSSLAFAQEKSGRSTSLGMIGVGAFGDARKNRVASTIKSLADATVTRVNARTYMKAKAISANLSLADKAGALQPIIASNGVDGLLVADVDDFEVRWSLIGSSGQVVSRGASKSAGLGKEGEISLTADRLVDSIAAAMPYRTFITKEVGLDVYEIGMGKNAGLTKGQKLRVFELKGNDFSSGRSETGLIEVVFVGEETAEVEVVSGKGVGVYQKVAFDEKSRGMNLQDPAPSKGHLMLGGGVFSIASDSPSPAYDQKVFRLSAAPALIFGAGIGKTEFSASFAQAQNVTEDLVYAEALLDRQWMNGGSGLWAWRFMGGLRFASYKVTTDSVLTTQLESLNAISPHFGFFYDQALAGPLGFTFGLEAMPLVYYAGGSGSGGSILFSYGGAISGGLRFDLSPRWSIEMLARSSAFRRPVDGQNAVQERHSNVNGTIKMRF